MTKSKEIRKPADRQKLRASDIPALTGLRIVGAVW
jgi:hypothetical protein